MSFAAEAQHVTNLITAKRFVYAAYDAKNT